VVATAEMSATSAVGFLTKIYSARTVSSFSAHAQHGVPTPGGRPSPPPRSAPRVGLKHDGGALRSATHAPARGNYRGRMPGW